MPRRTTYSVNSVPPVKSSSHRQQWIIVATLTILLVLITTLIIGATTVVFVSQSPSLSSSTSKSSSSSSSSSFEDSSQSTKTASSSSLPKSIQSHNTEAAESSSALPVQSEPPYSTSIAFVIPIKLPPTPDTITHVRIQYPHRLKPPPATPPSPEDDDPSDHDFHVHVDSGQFRPFYAPIWDPHPSYQFSAFGHDWILRLSESSSSSSHLLFPTVVIHHEGNMTRRDEIGVDTKCFYNGVVAGDRESAASLSLCEGMTGHIRTSSGSYFIEPVNVNNGHSNNNGTQTRVLHKLYRVVGTTGNNGNASAVSYHDDDGDDDDQDFIHRSSRFELEVEKDTKNGTIHDRHKRSTSTSTTATTVRIIRRRRSESSVRHIELMVATDSTMSLYHGDNLKHYVYTLLSIVALIYSDASIGNSMNIALVKFFILKDPNSIVRRSSSHSSSSQSQHRFDLLGNKISASEMLSGFCKWQKEHNDEDENSADHFDTALLLTRETICRNPQLNKCDTLGLAELGTMCDKYASCAIVQDNGLSAAFTIAHELGHLMNMPHDDDTKCVPFGGGARVTSSMEQPQQLPSNVNGRAHYVMSRMLDHNTYPWAWSRCSRHYLTEFLDVAGGHGKCLEDEPPLNLLPQNTKAPGEAFSKDEQCQLVFGPNSQLCSYMPVCRRLWCTSGDEEGGCRTQHMPWADGTPCSPTGQKWCQRGSCVVKDMEQLKVVDGHWGTWKPFGACSRACSGGVRVSTRECDNPSPSNGGKYCTGKRIQYESCNTHECPGEHKDFRAEQCAQFNNDNFNIQGLPRNVTWLPKYTGILPKDRCKLFCRVAGSSAYYLLREKVVDGTSCGPDTFDVCVNGNCVPAGCDRRLYSTKVLDSCGVCSGDSSTCRPVSGSYNETKYGYSSVVRIPSGASNLDIRQRGTNDSARDDNYLAIFDPATNEYLLNGHFVVSMFRKTIHALGTTLEYSGSDSTVERINSSSLPLKSDLIIQVLCVGKLYQPDIRFQYVISTPAAAAGSSQVIATTTAVAVTFPVTASPIITNRLVSFSYRWKQSDQLTECDRLCNGVQRRQFICIRVSPVVGHQLQQVDPAYCPGDSPEFQQQQTVQCNTNCVLKWSCSQSYSTSTLSDCQRDIACVHEVPSERTMAIVADEYCAHFPRECDDCPAGNEVADERQEEESSSSPEWSPCNRVCGDGISTCLKHCRTGESTRPCNDGACGQWRINEWSPCSTTCGSVGIHRALYSCHSVDGTGSLLSPDYCAGLAKPVVERRCENLPPCNLQWVVGEWSNCSVSCGQGKMRRVVQCVVENGVVNEKYCSGLLKPLEEADCQSNVECDLRNYAIDNYVVPFDGISAQVDWIVEAWSDCDEYADNFKVYRRRRVHCAKEQRQVGGGGCNGEDDQKKKPANVEECRDIWWRSEWGRCNTTCGDGIETRLVVCPTGSKCTTAAKPSSTRPCHSNSKCGKTRRGFYDGWNVGPWGKCSKLCGGGMRLRQVVCATATLGHCLAYNKPADRGNCNLEPCPIWHTSSWSVCSVECGGGGIQERSVVCRDHNGFVKPDEHCILTVRPATLQECGNKRCSGVNGVGKEFVARWRVGAWSNCTKTCGKGTKRRLVQCAKLLSVVNGENGLQEEIVSDDECMPKKPKPREERGCARFPCPFQWVVSDWSDCSVSCGYGIQQRNVSCHRVNKYGWVDPDSVSNGCEAAQKPKEYHYCKIGGECSSPYRWMTSEWSQCRSVNKNCRRQPKQKRRVWCGLKVTGQRVGGRFCSKTEKPERRKPCPIRSCKPSSCAEAAVTVEGEVQLWVGGTNVSIYCRRSSNGVDDNEIEEKFVEYLSLPEDNYAEFYAKRLIRPDTCPHNGARADNCDCVQDEDGRRRVGMTAYQKIRIDVKRLVVNVDDLTYARQISGSGIPFGHAGDCYSSQNCPQGRFSINLTGTGFQVAPVTTWISQGHKAAMWINRSEDNVRVSARCGGYCGNCQPDSIVGLKLEPV